MDQLSYLKKWTCALIRAKKLTTYIHSTDSWRHKLVENAGSTFTLNGNVIGFYYWFIRWVMFDSDILIPLWLWFILEGLERCFLSICHIYHCAYKSWERSLFSFGFFSCGNIELHCSNFLSEESNIRIPVLQNHNQHVAQIAAFKRYVYHLCPLTTQSLYQKNNGFDLPLTWLYNGHCYVTYAIYSYWLLKSGGKWKRFLVLHTMREKATSIIHVHRRFLLKTRFICDDIQYDAQ